MNPMSGNYLLLALLWTFYCVVHSALISITVTGFIKRVLAGRYRFFRLFFNLFSAVTLVPLVMYSHSSRFQTAVLFAWNGYWRIPQYCLIALAALLAVTGARHYSMRQFLGIQQALNNRAGRAMTESGGLDRTGVLGVVRHPWYVAVFLLIWANDLNTAAIMVNLVLSAYLVIGTLLEERKLRVEFGREYLQYQEDVSMFIPLKWLRARVHH